jgi:hypothetical protein
MSAFAPTADIGCAGYRLRPSDRELLDVLTRALSACGVGRAALAVGRPMLATNDGPSKLAMR